MTVSPRSSRAVEAALAYASLGSQVFPAFEIDASGVCACRRPDCNSPGKHPRTEHGFKDATTNVEQIAEWWSENPNANVAICTGAESGNFALDVDPAKGGSESLAALEKRHGPLPDTVEAITGGGGRHLEFAHPGVRVPNSIGFEPGLDIRGDGGYLIAAPSNHVSGGHYSWREGHAPGEIAVATAQQWFIDLVVKAPAKSTDEAPRSERKKPAQAGDDKCIAKLKKRGAGYVAKVQPATEGRRNKTAFSVAGHLASFVDKHGCRLATATIVELLSPWNSGCVPPLSACELDQCIQSAMTNGTPREDKGDDETPPLTDTGNAERLVAQFGADIRHCHPWKKWLAWDGRRWRVDESGAVMSHSKTVVRDLYAKSADIDEQSLREATAEWARRCEKVDRRKAMVDLARSERGIPVDPQTFDSHPTLLNVGNGVLDLETFELRPHQRDLYLTKICRTKYVAAAPCPVWTATLERILPDDEERAYFQRFMGYCLTGDVSEQVLLICHGDGANGKTTALVMVQQVLSSAFAIQISTDLLIAKKQRNHPTEVADLFGVRLAVGTELNEDQKFDEAFVKQLTGGDLIRARRIQENFWEFAPTHKIVLVTNHLPRIRGREHAIWRRIHALGFNVTIPVAERDKSLMRKLAAEREGILNWLVEGCRAWRKIGLAPPEGVQLRAPTEVEVTVVQCFVAECVSRKPGSRIAARDLWTAYERWSSDHAYERGTQTELGRAMGAAGYGRKKTGGAIVYIDTALSVVTAQKGGLGREGRHFDIDSFEGAHEATNAQGGPYYPQPSLAPSDGAEKADFRTPPVAAVTTAQPAIKTISDDWRTV